MQTTVKMHATLKKIFVGYYFQYIFLPPFFYSRSYRLFFRTYQSTASKSTTAFLFRLVVVVPASIASNIAWFCCLAQRLSSYSNKQPTTTGNTNNSGTRPASLFGDSLLTIKTNSSSSINNNTTDAVLPQHTTAGDRSPIPELGFEEFRSHVERFHSARALFSNMEKQHTPSSGAAPTTPSALQMSVINSSPSKTTAKC